MNTDYSILEENIKYVFKDKNLLINALTHTSFANEHKVKKIKDNFCGYTLPLCISQCRI